MPTAFDSVRAFAGRCAALEVCTTAELAARALSCTHEAARIALKLASDSGYLRPTLLPGLGNKIVYQPTPKAAGWQGANVPKFLRSGLSDEARWRGLLRGFVCCVSRPDLEFLTTSEQAELCRELGVPERGHARVLVGRDGDTLQVFVPILPTDAPAAAIMSAASRWLPLLSQDPRQLQLPLPCVPAPQAAVLHFIVSAGEPAETMAATLAELSPPLADKRAADELAALDLEISTDRTGLAAIRLSARRAELVARLVTEQPARAAYPWLGGMVEAAL